jgi:hypothetical protein
MGDPTYVKQGRHEAALNSHFNRSPLPIERAVLSLVSMKAADCRMRMTRWLHQSHAKGPEI